MNWIFENAEKLGGIATVVATLVAISATLVAIWALRTARSSQSEATAKDIYRDYLKLAFDHPEIASDFDKDELLHNKEKYEKYQWFVAFLLTSCDEIVRISPDDTWRRAILKDLEPHVWYLNSDFKNYEDWGLYSSKLRDLAQKAGARV